MNTFLNLLGVTLLAVLVLLPALVGFARERRIDRELRAAEHARRTDPPDPVPAQPLDAVRPRGATRRPYLRSWARV
ncbi:hypothetical protein OG233_09815 [Streptomyces sp. NBC_01218]|uniref:hypothetical protein n=1 Tax=Streptomyces sp. NBC_01218 TaxID=2903780 RepID=UPI002E156C80|nr:hypothetical protein OG233_09815 [Streptomyces sp. NBC_01218]